MAANEGHTDIAIALVAGGANINHQDKEGFTALHVAAQYLAKSVANKRMNGLSTKKGEKRKQEAFLFALVNLGADTQLRSKGIVSMKASTPLDACDDDLRERLEEAARQYRARQTATPPLQPATLSDNTPTATASDTTPAAAADDDGTPFDRVYSAVLLSLQQA
jgi:hypothetical protein